jgi:hypothetical protein
MKPAPARIRAARIRAARIRAPARDHHGLLKEGNLSVITPEFISFGDVGNAPTKDRSPWRKHLQPPQRLFPL